MFAGAGANEIPKVIHPCRLLCVHTNRQQQQPKIFELIQRKIFQNYFFFLVYLHLFPCSASVRAMMIGIGEGEAVKFTVF